MILLDTNVISEFMKTSPATQVINWVDKQEAMQLFITTLSIAEISYGLNVLPKGKRRNYLEDAFHNVIKESFKHRILAFEEPAAYVYGKIMAQRKKSGHPLSVLDGQISAIAYVHKAILATRNVRDFEDCGIKLINPFKD